MAERLCMHDDGYPAAPGKRKCVWHLLLKAPMEEQIAAAEARAPQEDIDRVPVKQGGTWRTQVPKAEWPDGERWCSGCQSFVPLFYCTGSRCKAHNAQAAHSGALSSKYGIDRETYLALLALQDGKCYICRQVPRSKRLAVDHDHKTGEVRGLLCADLERGCNHAVLGSLEARSVDGVIAAAYRLIEYMTKTPFQRLKEAPDADLAGAGDDRQNPVRADGGGTPDRAIEAPPVEPARRTAPLPGPPGADWRDDPDWCF